LAALALGVAVGTLVAGGIAVAVGATVAVLTMARVLVAAAAALVGGRAVADGAPPPHAVTSETSNRRVENSSAGRIFICRIIAGTIGDIR
jgi:hypothetical protein